MANKQHVDIADPDIHEPKGVSTALANMVYVSNGTGSGVWKKADTALLKGLTGDGGQANLKPVTDGSNGLKLVTDKVYGSMVINGNTNSFTLPAATDANLNTNTDYQVFTGTGAPWIASVEMFGAAFSVDRITVATAGVYKVEFWANISAFPTSTSKVSVKTKINGTTFSTRHPTVKSSVAGDIGTIRFHDVIPLSSGDYIQLSAASSGAGGLNISDAMLTVELMRAL